MKLLYLGWPRCGSTWLHMNIKNNTGLKDLAGIKESHMFLYQPDEALKLFTYDMMDFSTNNWSMDSWVAKKIIREIDMCIMIHRDAHSLIKSYHWGGSWQDWQTACKSNKLIDFGDTLSRWMDIAGPKLRLYEFADLGNDPDAFGRRVLGDMGYQDAVIDTMIVNSKGDKAHLIIDDKDLLSRIDAQEAKYQDLAKSLKSLSFLSH